MSPEGSILWNRDDFVGTALIDRPTRRNALNAELCESLRGHLAQNRDLRAVVIGGTGDRAFCAGADLVQRAVDGDAPGSGIGETFRPAFEALLDELVTFPAPVVCAVNGAALGAGMQLAVACDVRVVARSATFGIPAARLGLVISAVNVERLVRTVGHAVAADVLLTARVLQFDEAMNVGLVQRSADDAVEEAQELAREIARLAPLSMLGHKAMLLRISEVTALSAADRSKLAAYEARAFKSADLQKGLSAFALKRGPSFGGQ